MKTYNIYNAKGEYLGSIKATTESLLNHIIKSVYGEDARAIEVE